MSDEWWVETPRLAELIETWARETDATQLLLAEKADVSTRTIRRILTGENLRVTMETADRILTAMGAGWKLHEIPRHRRHTPEQPPSQFYEE
jgi:transcriptional regulator with XRE-family HTH domain